MMKFNLNIRYWMMFSEHVWDINWCLKFEKKGSNVNIFKTYVTDNYRATVE